MSEIQVKKDPIISLEEFNNNGPFIFSDLVKDDEIEASEWTKYEKLARDVIYNVMPALYVFKDGGLIADGYVIATTQERALPKFSQDCIKKATIYLIESMKNGHRPYWDNKVPFNINNGPISNSLGVFIDEELYDKLTPNVKAWLAKARVDEYVDNELVDLTTIPSEYVKWTNLFAKYVFLEGHDQFENIQQGFDWLYEKLESGELGAKKFQQLENDTSIPGDDGQQVIEYLNTSIEGKADVSLVNSKASIEYVDNKDAALQSSLNSLYDSVATIYVEKADLSYVDIADGSLDTKINAVIDTISRLPNNDIGVYKGISDFTLSTSAVPFGINVSVQPQTEDLVLGVGTFTTNKDGNVSINLLGNVARSENNNTPTITFRIYQSGSVVAEQSISFNFTSQVQLDNQSVNITFAGVAGTYDMRCISTQPIIIRSGGITSISLFGKGVGDAIFKDGVLVNDVNWSDKVESKSEIATIGYDALSQVQLQMVDKDTKGEKMRFNMSDAQGEFKFLFYDGNKVLLRSYRLNRDGVIDSDDLTTKEYVDDAVTGALSYTPLVLPTDGDGNVIISDDTTLLNGKKITIPNIHTQIDVINLFDIMSITTVSGSKYSIINHSIHPKFNFDNNIKSFGVAVNQNDGSLVILQTQIIENGIVFNLDYGLYLLPIIGISVSETNKTFGVRGGENE